MRRAKGLTNKEKQEWADREWKQGDCECEDPYRFGLPCQHLLIQSLMQKIPISLALIHPRWCVATKLIAAPNWQPRYIEDMSF
jgi:hypothetical protein